SRIAPGRQGEGRQLESRRRLHGADLLANGVPTPEKFGLEFPVLACPAHLFGDEGPVLFHGFTDLCQHAHDRSSAKSCVTPGSRWRLATVAMIRCRRPLPAMRWPISARAVAVPVRSPLLTTMMSARSSMAIFWSCRRLP